MTDSDFDKVFGRSPITAPPSFADRVARENGSPPGEPKEGTVGSGPYKPYGFLPSGSINECCDVQRWLDQTDMAEGIEFQYRFLMQIGYVGEEQLKLFLPDCIVVIEGHYLRDLRKKLARRQVTFIQQYSPKVWSASPQRGEPIIVRIEVVRPDAPHGNR